jgi:hypothetical protein
VPRLIAYRTSDSAHGIDPAPRKRSWMEATPKRYAYRCLPLSIANQAGWLIRTEHEVRVTWLGGDALNRLLVQAPGGNASSHFGSGILTFQIPYLFRTPDGWNLWVRGPTNAPKDGICALDGVVETDTTYASFTMNWKLTRTHHEIRFAPGEPICMVFPQQRGMLESFDPQIDDLPATVRAKYEAWRKDRSSFVSELQVPGSAAQEAEWQRDYMQGAAQRKLALKSF